MELLRFQIQRTAATIELLLGTQFQDIEILMYACALERAALDVHMYALDNEVDAEAAFDWEGPADHRTKRVLAKSLQRHGELLPRETLQSLWHLTLKELRGRTASLCHVPRGPLVGLATPAPLAGRGRGRGRGLGRGLVVALPAGRAYPAHFAGRGRVRGRGRGRGPLP